jgi:hypothetical protein
MDVGSIQPSASFSLAFETITQVQRMAAIRPSETMTTNGPWPILILAGAEVACEAPLAVSPPPQT